MTLVELLIAVVLSGMIAAVIGSAITVTLRQSRPVEGRINLAKSEQSIAMWLPNDLASAGSYTTDPGASPCGAPVCDGIDLSNGSNVLMLTWTTEYATATGTESLVTNVSYNFHPSADGSSFELTRVSCVQTSGGGWECTSITLLTNMPPPPPGIGWTPGVSYGEDQCLPAPGTVECTIPIWVIEVSTPLAPDATSDDPTNYATGDQVKDANRVIVTIDGGGGGDAATGGQTRISITAGGTNREIIDASSLIGAPSFEEARSRCGGPMTLIVDESNSINNDGGGAAVLAAVRQFVNTLVGTPVQLQIVEFSTTAKVLGSGGSWSRYFNMLDVDGDVRQLVSDRDLNGVSDNGFLGQMVINGGTNWDDAMFRTFYNEDGTIHDTYPETVVFFTDGAPTYDRQSGAQKTGGDLEGQPSYARPPYANATGSSYNQVAFNRAAYIAGLNRTRTRLIGVGVGGINDNLTWVSNPGTGYVLEWERGYYRYKRVETGVYQTNRSNYQIVNQWRSNLDYEYRSGGSWSSVTDVSADTYFANNSGTTHTGQNDADRYRIRRGSSSYSTRSGTPANSNNLAYAKRYVNEVGQFNSGNFEVRSRTASNAAAYKAATAAERERLFTFTTNGSWTTIDAAAYNAGNYTSDDTDGFRIGTIETWVTKAEYEAGLANPQPNISWVDTGTNTPADTDAAARDWEPVPSPYGTAQNQLNNENNSNDGYRATRTYPATAPAGGYLGYTPATTSTKTGAQILANLIAGDDIGTPWTQSPDNSVIANMYVLPPANQGGFSQLEGALKSVALGECGGTLTLQTKVTSGATTTNARDPFTYQNTAAWDHNGTPLTIAQTVVTTNQQYPSRTFDFTVDSGQYVTIELRPQNFAELDEYTPAAVPWSCRRGIEPMTSGTGSPTDTQFQTFAITDELGNPTGWTGIRIRVRSNSALACTLNVTA